MKLGIVIGTFAAVPYVHLQLEAAKRLYPDVRVLVHDDASGRGAEIAALCLRYEAEFACNSERQVHHLGDLSVYPAGLVWAARNGIELLLKVSRRWIWREDWRPSLLVRSAESDGTTFSNYTRSYAFGFRTECVAFDVKTWTCAEFMSAVAERLVAGEPCFVENYIHQWAIKFSERGSRKWKDWEASNPVPQERSGYAPWDFMGTCRHERIAGRLWHNCDGPRDYAALASQWGLPYTAADFADPNMGEGIGEAQPALSMAGAGLPPLLADLGEGLVGAEIGVWRGATTRHLLRCPNVSKLFGIDPFVAYDDWWAHIGQEVLDNHRAEVMRGLSAHPRFELLQTTSIEALKQIGTLDFVFIDGNHAGDQVSHDLESYWLKLRTGGLMSGHDYRTLPTVKNAVDSFAKKVKATVSETTNDVWYFSKPRFTMPRLVV